MARKNSLACLLDNELPKLEKQIEASKWYGANEEAVRKKYDGMFIAIRGREVKSSKDSGVLRSKLADSSEWFITFVPKEKMIACW